MQFLFLEPLDVFSIRSARPFDIGGVTHADFVWPPPTWTVMGALRGALAEVLGLPAVEYGRASSTHPEKSAVTQRIGPGDGAATFQIGPVLLAVEQSHGWDLRWPVPADVLPVRSSSGKVQLQRLTAFAMPEGYACNLPDERTHVVAPPPTLGERPEKSSSLRHFTLAQLLAWLREEPLPAPTDDGDPDYLVEPRIGIQIENEKNTVREGRFYVRNAVQLAERRVLAVPLVDPGTQLPWEELENQAVRFGADGHLVRIRKLVDNVQVPKAPSDPPLTRARILCVGPIHPEDLRHLRAGNHGVEVRAVAAGRPVRIGGWRLFASKRNGSEVQFGPRPLRSYYPGGTVLYVESDGDLRQLHGKNLASNAEEKAAGFGFCLVGRWQ